MVDQNQSLVAFLAVHSTKDGEGYLGGLLVTDETGIPKEFRCTQPIRPSATQKALYGANLRPHVFTQLLGVPLIRALTTRPLFCSVAEPVLLRVRNDIDLPVFHLQRLGEVLSAAPAESNGSNSPPISSRIDSEYGGFQPISVTCQHGHESDLETMNGHLHRVFNQIDLVEPFERIATAINALIERDSRFQ